MSFKTDYTQAKEASELQDGRYHVRFEKFDLQQTKNGVEFINLQFRIRNDVEQPFQNFCIFEKIFKKKETGEWITFALHTMGKVLKLPDGKEYKNISAFLKECVGRVCTVTLKTKKETFDNQVYENQRIVKWESYESDTSAGVSDDDLPF